jgi:alpha-ketoglutarate-dependent taurine dioxygenase
MILGSRPAAWRAHELDPRRFIARVDVSEARDQLSFCLALTEIAHRVHRAVREIGFVVVDRIPEALLDDEHRADAFLAVGELLGAPLAQDDGGTILLDIGGASAGEIARTAGYRMGTGLHTDGACGVTRPDVVAFLCVQSAPSGGLSQLASAATVIDHLRDQPDVLQALATPFAFDAKRQQRADAQARERTPIVTRHGDDFDFRYLYYQMSGDGVTPEQHRALAMLEDAIRAHGVVLEFVLARGQVLMLDNHHLLHGRTRYADHAEDRYRRHVVRLWLTENTTLHFTG